MPTDSLQKLLEKELGDAPSLLLRSLIEKKLRAAGVEPDSVVVDRILNHIRRGSSESFQWESDSTTDKNIEIVFSNEDLDELEKMSLKFLESVPNVVVDIASAIADSLQGELHDNWGEEHLRLKEEMLSFRGRLEQRWGNGLKLLRMMLTISRELGSEVTRRLPLHKSTVHDVLTRLHVRACQVTDEIITLLENGFADGAMARWRTLHEISIVMILIRDHGQQLAERYLAHRYVEAKSGKDQYMLCCERLGYKKLSLTECQEIDEAYDRVVALYGDEFRGPYGWAEGYVSKGRRRAVGLGDLEAAAGRAAMGPYYKLASYNVHAGPHALFFRLGLMGEPGLLAGASDAGLLEPGQNTAFSLTMISVALGAGDDVTLDTLVSMKILQALRDTASRAFYLAEQSSAPEILRRKKRKRAFGMTQRFRSKRMRFSPSRS